MSPAPAAAPARAVLRRTYASADLAGSLARSLAPDNAGFVRCLVKGCELRLEVEAKSVGELQRTLDDALACLSTAERTWRSAHGDALPLPETGAVAEDEERDE